MSTLKPRKSSFEIGSQICKIKFVQNVMFERTHEGQTVRIIFNTCSQSNLSHSTKHHPQVMKLTCKGSKPSYTHMQLKTQPRTEETKSKNQHKHVYFHYHTLGLLDLLRRNSPYLDFLLKPWVPLAWGAPRLFFQAPKWCLLWTIYGRLKRLRVYIKRNQKKWSCTSRSYPFSPMDLSK